jgi:hypothetical protein
VPRSASRTSTGLRKSKRPIRSPWPGFPVRARACARAHSDPRRARADHGALPGALAKPAAPAAQQQSRPSTCAPFFILSDVVIGAMHSISSMRFGRIKFSTRSHRWGGCVLVYRRFFTAIPAVCLCMEKEHKKDGREGLLRSPGRREAGPAGRAAVRARVIV